MIWRAVSTQQGEKRSQESNTWNKIKTAWRKSREVFLLTWDISAKQADEKQPSKKGDLWKRNWLEIKLREKETKA